jgi:ferredoxin
MPPRMGARLRVDWILCDGYGLCGDLLPDLIELDDWRYPILPAEPIDGALLHDAQRAVDCCPMKALVLEPVRPDERRG